MQPHHCPSCGKPNALDAKFCDECARPMAFTIEMPPPVQAVWQPKLKRVRLQSSPKSLSKSFYLGLAIFCLCAALIILMVVQADKGKNQKTPGDKAAQKINSSDLTPPAKPDQAKSAAKELLRDAREILKDKNAGETLATAVTVLNAIPPQASEYVEARTLLKQANARILAYQNLKGKNQAGVSRDSLLESYRSTFTTANPYINFIKTKLTRDRDGYSIWLIHSMFNQNSLNVGPEAQTVQTWIKANRAELEKANIRKVGLRNESGYLGECWLDLKSTGTPSPARN
jgi:hypothetical protein